jgi:hypothetical protein
MVSGSGRGESFLQPGPPLSRAQPRILVLGFMGGRDKADDPGVGVGKFAKQLREMDLPCVHVETFENTRRERALEAVRSVFDQNHDGQIDAGELASTRLVLYGQSFGGAAVVNFARQLKAAGIPVLLTVQVDAVGRNDRLIPSNVAAAANLYQHNGLLIHGPRQIAAEDPRTTRIIGNYQFTYRDSTTDLSDLPWHKKVFQGSHRRMDRDPAVWGKVEELILMTLADQGWCSSF